MHLDVYQNAGVQKQERFLFRKNMIKNLITLQPSNHGKFQKGSYSRRMAGIHLLLLSGSVGSVWNDSSQFILLYPLQKGYAARNSACFTLFVAIFVYVLNRS